MENKDLKVEISLLKQRIHDLEQAEAGRKQELETYQNILKENLMRYNDLIDNSRGIILEWDTQGNILFLNKYGQDLFGFTMEELLGRNVVGTIVPALDRSGTNLVDKMIKVQKTPDEFYSSENENIKKNGEPVWIAWTNRGILDQDGKLIKTLSIGIDRTLQRQYEVTLIQHKAELETKVAEQNQELRETVAARTRELEELNRMSEALRISEERFKLSMQATKDGLWDWDIQSDACYFSPGYYNMLGYEVDEFPETISFWLDKIHPDDRENAFRANMDCIEGRVEQFATEFRMRTQNREWRWILGRGKCIGRDANGRAIRLIGTHVDITERKNIEQQIQDSEALFRSQFEYSNIGMAITSPDKRWLRVNTRLCKMLGYSEEELQQKTWADITYPEDIESDQNQFNRVLAGEIESYEMEKRFVTSNSSLVFSLLTVACVRDHDNSIKYFVFSVQNITELKRTEEALRSKQIMLARTEGIAHVGSWEWDIASDTVTWSDELFRIFQRDPQERAPSFAEHPALYHPEDMARLRQAVEAAVADGTPYELELRAIRKDGETRACLARGFADMAKGVRAVRLFGSLQDISERKKVEEALSASEQSFRSSFDNSTLGIRIVTGEGETLYINQTLLDIFGYANLEEYTAISNKQRYTPESYLAHRQRLDQREKGEAVPPSYETSIVRKNGEVRVLAVSRGEVVWNGEKQFQVIYQDITEHRNSELALLESQKRFQALVETTNDFIWEMNLKGVYTYCSPQMERLWGLKPEEMLGKTPFDLLPPEDREQAIKAFSALAESSSPLINMEIRSFDGTGRVIFLEISGVPFFDIAGKHCGYRGITRDITERKQAEDKLRKSEEINRRLADYHKQLNDISITFGEAFDTADLFEKIAESFRFLTGANASSFAVYDQQARVLKAVSLSIDPISRDSVISMLRTDLFKMQIPVSTDDIEQMLTQGIRRPKDLHELTSGQLPRDISDSVMEAIECQQIVALAISYSGEMMGTCVAYLRGDQAVVPDEALKTFISLSGIAIKRKRAEEALKESQEQYQKLVDNANEAIVVEQDGVVKFINRTTTEMFKGYSESELLARSFVDFIHLDDRVRIIENHLKRMRNDPVPPRNEYRLSMPDGSFRWVDIGTALIEWKGRLATLNFITDITESKNAEAQTIEIEALKLANQAKSELLANVSHELRTPLASIKGFIETLIETDVKWSKKQQLEFLKSANMEADRLTLLIRDLLDMSRIDSGKLTLDKRSYLVSQILDSAGSVLSVITEKHKLKIVQAPDLPPLQADKVRIGQVITNLVENAAKFSAEGSQIEISAIFKDKKVIISVEDSGMGMPPEVVEKLFDRFYQSYRVVEGKTRGTGLGLAICKGIVDAHSGKIWVESQVGKGSKFSFSIPVNDL